MVQIDATGVSSMSITKQSLSSRLRLSNESPVKALSLYSSCAAVVSVSFLKFLKTVFHFIFFFKRKKDIRLMVDPLTLRCCIKIWLNFDKSRNVINRQS